MQNALSEKIFLKITFDYRKEKKKEKNADNDIIIFTFRKIEKLLKDPCNILNDGLLKPC